MLADLSLGAGAARARRAPRNRLRDALLDLADHQATILSHKENTVRIINPWPSEAEVFEVSANDRAPVAVEIRELTITFKTRAGRSYHVAAKAP